jgi:Arc/MetJ family transcription regulator
MLLYAQKEFIYMRTTLDLPAELLNEAQEILGFKSKTDTIILSLQELIKKRKREEIKSLSGKAILDIDVNTARRRKQSRL